MSPFGLVVVLLLQLEPSFFSSGSSIPDSSPARFQSLSLSRSDDTSESPLDAIIKEELQALRMDLTKSFIAEHSRKKREILGYTYEVSLNYTSPDVFEARTESVGFSSVIYNNKTYIFQADGIYELGFQPEAKSRPTLVKVTTWTLERGERVLSAFEWSQKLFILTANQNGSYSKLYTVQTPDYSLILRQQIRNQGYATAAKFFTHGYDLFLIIATDNAVHSLTITPVYRWSQTYMDQIHEIQTRGASALEVFGISSNTYIAIAQAQDAAGNYEVGTLILRMYGKGYLEKVQLLWSIEPVSLSYVRVLEEHFLVIGQNRESSICYWFGGYDFLYWHSLDGLQGKSLHLTSLVLPDKEPLLLAATESTVFLYTRVSNSELRETSILNRTSVIYSTASGQKIVEARFLITFKVSSVRPVVVYLALTLQSFSGYQLKVYPLNLVKKDLAPSSYTDPEDKLTSCMVSLKHALDLDEPSLIELELASPSILTRSGDWDYTGSLVSQSITAFGGEEADIGIAVIRPEITNSAGEYKYPPSVTLGLIDKEISAFDGILGRKLGNVLLKSRPGNITGQLTFPKGLTIQKLQSSSQIQLDNLNGVLWSTLENDVLQSDLNKNQVVRGIWNIDTLRAESVLTGNRLGNVLIDDFLLTTCSRPGYSEVLQGEVLFSDNLEFTQGLALGPSATINNISFSNIALRSQQYSDIRGYKHADYVNAGDDMNVSYLNGLKLSDWYNSVLKTTGEEQSSTGTKIFTGELVIDSLQVQLLNGRNWNDFQESVLLNGRNQTLLGDIKCDRLRTNSLEVETINGRYVSDWMTTTTDQQIQSDIHVGDLRIRSNLYTKTINGIQLSDAISSIDQDVEIRGPVQLQRFTVGNVSLPDYVRINSIDISEAAKLRKKHIYSTANGEDLYIDGNVQVGNLEASSLNDIPFESIQNAYWKANADNEVESEFNFGSNEVVIQNKFSTGTLNGLDLNQDILSTTRNNEVINTNIQFPSDVVVEGEILFPDGGTLNDIDFSEVEKAIVRTTDGDRFIRGKKTFQDAVEVNYGLEVKSVNGITLENDLVFLSKYGTQEIRGTKKFQEVFANDVVSEVDVEVSGTVNGYRLKEVAETTVSSSVEKIRIESDVVFQKQLTAEDLYVKNEINHIRFGDIVAHIIGLDEAQKLEVALTIAGGTLRFKQDSIVALINNVVLQEYLPKIVNKYTDCHFNGTKHFQNVIIDGNLGCTVINQINLQELEQYAFSKTRDQTITGKFKFEEVHSNGNLITERIGGILISDFARTNENCVIHSDVIFRNRETKVNGKIYLNGLLNNYKIEEVAEGLQSLKGNRRFESIIVEGNLSWEYARPDLKRISYLLEYAVTIATPQTLTQKIAFTNGFRANTVQTERWINNIDLARIQEDVVYKNQAVVFKGVNTFEHGIEVTRGTVIVLRHLNANQINNIILRDLYQQVVLIDSTRRIRGVKTFLNGIAAERLQIYGTIDGILPKDLVTVNETRTIDKITIKDAVILKNLNYQRFDGFQLPIQRITLDENQRIRGDLYIGGNVVIEDCSVISINGLEISDLFLANSNSVQVITGSKTFTDLILEGNFDDVPINGIYMDYIGSQILRRHEDEVIDRHVIFTDTVQFLEYVNVSTHINNYNIDQVSEAFTSKLEGILGNVQVTEATKREATELILSLQATQEVKAVWLDYLRVRQEWFGLGPKSRVEYIVEGDDSSVAIALHQPIDGSAAGLPQGCHCNSIQFLELNENFIARKIGLVNCVNIFDVRSPSGSSYTVYSHPASYNQTCSKSESSSTYVSSMVAQEHRYKIEHGGSVPIAEFSLGRLETGYISDVKTFSVDGQDYLVFAQYYDSRSGSHKTEVLIYATGNGNLRKVQGISSNGATRLALELVDHQWTLVIGSSAWIPTEEVNCEVYSSIYQWSTQRNEFLLIRDVQTTGLVDVSLLSIDKNGYFHDAFAVFAANGADGNFGSVTIYRYNAETSSYLVYQNIAVDGRISAIYGFSLPQFSYLVVASPVNGLQFYHYLHAEGFKLQLTVPIVEAQDTNAIVWKNEIFFPIAATNRGSLNAQAVIEGLLEPRLLPQLSTLYESDLSKVTSY